MQALNIPVLAFGVIFFEAAVLSLPALVGTKKLNNVTLCHLIAWTQHLVSGVHLLWPAVAEANSELLP